MAVKIRMKRMGSKKQPFYRLVVADSRSPRDGRIIEQVGHYNPMNEEKTLKIEEDKILKWLNTGAQPPETVKRLLKAEGVLEKFEASKKA